MSPAGTTLEIALVDAPEISDAALDADGAHVFLEPDVAEFLDDKVLDVEPGEAGPTFMIRGQSSFDRWSNGRPREGPAG